MTNVDAKREKRIGFLNDSVRVAKDCNGILKVDPNGPAWMIDIETSFYNLRSFTPEELVEMKRRCLLAEVE